MMTAADVHVALDAIDAAGASCWIGGGWGWVDPVKEVEASKQAIAGNLSTLAEEAAGQGRDWEEIFMQRKRERDKASELDLPDVADSENNGGNEDAETNEG